MKSNTGFTIIEVLIVIAIIGVAAAFGIPAYMSQLPDMRLKAATNDIKTDMEIAKLRAIRENASVAVVFNTGNDSYQVFVDNGAGGGTENNYTVDGTESVLKSVTISDDVDLYQTTFTNDRTRFNGRALPNIIGSAYMKNTKNTYRGISLSIVGKVQIKESTNGGSTWTDVD